MKYLALGDRLRIFREKKSLTTKQLADRVGIPENELDLIEQNKTAPKIAQLIRFAKELDINVADIFRDRPQEKSFDLIRKGDRQRFSPLLEPNAKSKIYDYSYEMLTTPGERKHLDAYLIEIPALQEKKPYENLTHPGEEFIFVLEGKLEGEIDAQAISLSAGDSLFFRSNTPHSFYNPYEETARAITVIYPF